MGIGFAGAKQVYDIKKGKCIHLHVSKAAKLSKPGLPEVTCIKGTPTGTTYLIMGFTWDTS